MTDATADKAKRPYPPSLFDRYTGWVDTLPARPWIYYVGLAFILLLGQLLFLWIDGGLHATELLPVAIFNAIFTSFPLALIHLLDNQAIAALDALRPILDMAESEFDDFHYRLSTMPPRPPLIVGLGVLAFAVLMEQLWIAPFRFAALEQLPIFNVVFQIVDKTPAVLLGAFLYHSIRQLRLVTVIHSEHVHISLFNLGPTQAFSKLTASTAMGLVAGIYPWMLINPELLKDPVSIGFVAAFTILAVAVFVWPLLGAHSLIEKEKARTLLELDRHFEAALVQFDSRLRDDDYPAVERLNGIIASLEIQRKRILAIPTWPWRPETARFALTAIALPLLLTILQFLVVQAISR
jgi:hypothetical protein